MHAARCILFGLLLTGMGATASGGPTRSFLLGMTTFPYAYTAEAMAETNAFIAGNADLIVFHHDGGVPWVEALPGDDAYLPNVIAEINDEADAVAPGQKVYVSVTPSSQNRNAELADYWGADHGLPLPAGWDTKQLDDPDVVTAYTNWCRYLITKLQPDYFAFGIEVALGFSGPDDPTLPQLQTLMAQVYATLKAENPDLPLFLTFTISSLEADQASYQQVVSSLLPFSDMLGVSVYPYGIFVPGGIETHDDPATIPTDYLTRLTDLAQGKPVVISETGYPAENLDISIPPAPPVPGFELHIAATPQWQSDYVQKLLTDINAMGVEFCVWFLPRDHDLLNQQFMDLGIPLDPFAFFFWRDDGLLDGAGAERLSLTTWRQWLALPQRRPSDINHDGAVDTADLGLLIGAFGGADFRVDLNADGEVDTADLGLLISDYSGRP